MKIVFDVADLLQLQEIWVRRPIAQAYMRLERRQTTLPCPVDFQLKNLMPRLGQLRNSAAWQTNRLERHNDPAQLPMCALTDAYLEILFPDIPSAALARQRLFLSVYNHFVVVQYIGDYIETRALLRLLVQVRAVDAQDCLGDLSLPLEGSNFWIPVDLTDEIRALDARYDSSKPDTPAAYVISENFWPLLVKASLGDIQAAAVSYCQEIGISDAGAVMRRLRRLVELAQDWNRSSSVVGLFYQIHDDTSEVNGL